MHAMLQSPSAASARAGTLLTGLPACAGVGAVQTERFGWRGPWRDPDVSRAAENRFPDQRIKAEAASSDAVDALRQKPAGLDDLATRDRAGDGPDVTCRLPAGCCARLMPSDRWRDQRGYHIDSESDQP